VIIDNENRNPSLGRGGFLFDWLRANVEKVFVEEGR
jgi:hypothetical protein